MLDETAHPRPGDSTTTEDLHGITRSFLRRLCRVHFQQGNWSGKVLRLLLVRLFLFEQNVKVFELKWTHHIVHLMRNVLQPTLYGLYARNHGSDLTADDSLRCQGLSKCLSLTDPFQTFLHDRALSMCGGCDHYPTFMIEIADELKCMKMMLCAD